MTTPVPADLDDRLARLDARLEAVETELARWRTSAPPHPTPATSGPYPAGPHPGGVPPQPGMHHPGPWQPAPAGFHQGPPRPGEPHPQPPFAGPHPPPPWYGDRPAPVGRPARDWSRLPVWAGAGVTFVGVVLLLVLAASSDWFGPLARVLAGAVLAAGLLAIAGWLVRRAGRAGIGPSALAGTGVTALFASVAAATSLYELLGPVVGSLLCLLVAGAGIALADRWDTARLAVAVLVGAEIALILVAGELDALSLGLALVVQLGVVPTALRRAPVLAPVAAGGTALHGLLAGPLVTFDAGVRTPGVLFAVSVTALVLGAAVAVLGALRGTRVPAVVGLATAPVPMLGTLPAVGTGPGVAVTLAAAVAVAAATFVPGIARIVRAALVSVAVLLVATATVLLLDGVTLAAVLLAEAAVLLGPAAWLRSRPLQLAGAWLAVVGGLTALPTALEPDTILDPVRFPATQIPPGALVVAVLLVLAAGAGLAAAVRTGIPTTASWAAWAWLPVGAALYGASWFVVAGAQLLVTGQAGFLGGHVLVTLGVTGLGVALLVRGLHRPTVGRTGFALVVAALVKLVLFDLVTLDGLARVAAFIGAGLVLLAVGTWYANRVSPVSPGTATGAGPGAVIGGGPPAGPATTGDGPPAGPTGDGR